jgi:hypothetical protein
MTNMKEQIKAYKEALLKLERQKESSKSLALGCEVTLGNGTKQTITKIEWGVAYGDNAFYRWDSFFPYDIEHAAMYGSNLEIVDVKW